MADNVTEQFIEALERLEAEGDVDSIAELFDEDCEVGNVTLAETLHGTDGARKFWTNYRETLGEVRSKFRNRIVADGASALEWSTEGRDGEVSYEGVSIIESDGGKIRRFFAYFDPGKLGKQIEAR